MLTGPSGTGNTATAQTLAGESGSPRVHLHSGDDWHFINPARFTLTENLCMIAMGLWMSLRMWLLCGSRPPGRG